MLYISREKASFDRSFDFSFDRELKVHNLLIPKCFYQEDKASYDVSFDRSFAASRYIIRFLSATNIVTEIPVKNIGRIQSYYSFTFKLPDTMQTGSYTYEVIIDDIVLYTGVAYVSKDMIDYEINEQRKEYYQYER